jgi:hypothetical protein
MKGLNMEERATVLRAMSGESAHAGPSETIFVPVSPPRWPWRFGP